jgi:hypothetical protein
MTLAPIDELNGSRLAKNLQKYCIFVRISRGSQGLLYENDVTGLLTGAHNKVSEREEHP